MPGLGRPYGKATSAGSAVWGMSWPACGPAGESSPSVAAGTLNPTATWALSVGWGLFALFVAFAAVYWWKQGGQRKANPWGDP